MSTKHVVHAVERLGEYLGAKITPAEERGYYHLNWPGRKSRMPSVAAKPLSLLARLLSVAVSPVAVGGGGFTAEQAGEAAELVTVPSLDGLAGWEQNLIEAALPAQLRDALRRNKRRREQ